MKLVPENLDSLVLPAANWGIFFVAAVVFYALQYRRHASNPSLSDFFGFTFPLRDWASRSGFVDIVMYLGGKFFNGLSMASHQLLMVVVAGAVAAMLLSAFPGYRSMIADPVVVAILWVSLFVVGDFAGYLTHYLQHRVPFLWELHKVHHSARFLTPFTAKRLHPVEVQLGLWVGSLLTGVPAGLAIFLYNLSMAEVFMIAASATAIIPLLLLDPLKHSHVPMSFGPLDRIFQSPHMHQLHHSEKYEHWDKNFGSKLSIFDWLFGTMLIPAKAEPLIYGIGRGTAIDEQYDSIYGCYLRPTLDMVTVLCGRRSPHELPIPTSLVQARATIASELGESAVRSGAEQAVGIVTQQADADDVLQLQGHD